MKKLGFVTTVAFVLILIGIPPFVPADWITGAGGNAARTGYVDTVGPIQPNRLWEGVRFTRATRPIVVAEGRIYGTWFESGNPFNEVFVLDLLSGTELWSVELPADGLDTTSYRSRVSAVRDGQAYLTRASGTSNPAPIYAHDAVTGDLLWQSADKVGEHSSNSCSFAPDGDLIILGGLFPDQLLLRIDKDTGATIWSVPIEPDTDDGIGAVVWGDRVYAFSWIAFPGGSSIGVKAFDLATGAFVCNSPDLVWWGASVQHGLFIGLDGKIYAVRASSQDYLNYIYALEDSGTSLDIVWTYTAGYGWASTFGVGPDGSIYSHDIDGHLIRLDPTDGSLIARTVAPLPGHDVGSWYDWSPRLAVDSQGKVFATNGSYAAGTLSAYDSDLKLLWTEDVGTMSITGPALSSTGELVLQTRYQGMIVYTSTIFADGFESGDTGAWSGQQP
ncbi:MAG: PQQ-binding-like beta-propeller repeat protein [Acidobacteriota bacterium]